jgi:hypothetical protein
VASVDTHPLRTMKVKKELIKIAIDGGWMFAFDHDPDMKLCRLKKVNDTFVPSKIEA